MPFRLDTDATYRAMVTELAADLGVEIVVNSVAEIDGGGFANSAFLVDGSGIGPRRYDKVHLVPFGETVPPWADLFAGEALVREVGNFTPGAAVVTLPAVAPLGVSICYEVVFSSHSGAAVRAGAELLVTLTNDGWYGFSWAPEQHFAQVRLRAAEHRRWFARAALTGISAFVDPTGRAVSRLEIGEQGVLLADLPPSNGLTPRSRWGDWWAVLCAAASVAMLAQSRRSADARHVKRS
jgi:apolipoprotein N-acyltransferase